MKYKKISGTKSGFGKYHSLWTGEDHLLAVESTGYSEDYTRYYFKDIQALVSRRTPRGIILSAALGLLTAICLFPAVSTGSGGRVWIVPAGFFLLLLFINLFRGPTCRCHLYTELGSNELPTLSRLRKVKKLVDRLHPLIALSQGEVDRDQISVLTAAALTGPAPTVAPAARPSIPPSPAPQGIAPPCSGKMHLYAFLLLVLHASVVALWQLYGANALFWFIIAISPVFFGVAIVALVKQREQTVAPLAKWMIWSGIAALSGGSLGGYFFNFFLNMKRLGQVKPGSLDQFEMIRVVSPAGHQAYSAFLLVYAAVTAVIALTGLVALRTRPVQGAGHQP